MLHDLHDSSGAVVAQVIFFADELERLERGETISREWRTPSMLLSAIGTEAGAFDVTRNPNGRFITSDAESAKTYASLTREIINRKAELLAHAGVAE